MTALQFGRRKYLYLALVSLIVAVGVAVTLYLRRDRTIATVGDYEITPRDVNYRDQINRMFYPDDPDSYGLEQLTKSLTFAQILKNNGLEINEHTLRTEEMRINQNTKDPAMLRKIQELFAGDDDAYQKVFILPTYADRTIYYDFFIKNQKVQSKSLSRVREFIAEVTTSKKSLAEVATLQNHPIRTFSISRREGIVWNAASPPGKNAKDAPQPVKVSTAPIAVQAQVDRRFQAEGQQSAEFWIEKVLPRLKLGDMLPEPVDFGEQWLVVKFSKPLSKDKFQMEAVSFPKDSYEEWLAAEKVKVQIR